jgi:hypothetical protein
VKRPVSAAQVSRRPMRLLGIGASTSPLLGACVLACPSFAIACLPDARTIACPTPAAKVRFESPIRGGVRRESVHRGMIRTLMKISAQRLFCANLIIDWIAPGGTASADRRQASLSQSAQKGQWSDHDMAWPAAQGVLAPVQGVPAVQCRAGAILHCRGSAAAGLAVQAAVDCGPERPWPMVEQASNAGRAG